MGSMVELQVHSLNNQAVQNDSIPNISLFFTEVQQPSKAINFTQSNPNSQTLLSRSDMFHLEK